MSPREELEVQPYPTAHRPCLSPKRPRQNRRESGVSAAMWVELEKKYRSLGYLHRCVESSWKPNLHDPPPPRGVPILQTAKAGPEGLGRICRCVGRTWKSNHTRPPKGPPYAPKAPSRIGGTWLSAPLCGEELEVQSYSTPPTVCPYPVNGPSTTRETRV